MMRHEDEIKQGITTTLDEPVRETILRDLRQVADKLKVVLLPLGAGSQENVLQKLREWDLWGPLLVCLLLSSVLSLSAPGDSASLVFAAVFVIVWAGTDSRYWAVHKSPLALTSPTFSSSHFPSRRCGRYPQRPASRRHHLLLPGAPRSHARSTPIRPSACSPLFPSPPPSQSVCILGYCVFPLTLSALACFILSFIVTSLLVKLLLVGVGFVWSTRASVVFMVKVIKEERR